jgi:riboflavin synthase
MFTGIVESIGTLLMIDKLGNAAKLVVKCPPKIDAVKIGDSLALNGCCLTAVGCQGSLEFEAGAETLGRTNLGQLQIGDPLNIERSLSAMARLGGHFVTGHIDCVGTVEERIDEQEWSTIWISIPMAWSRYLVSKGSIAVDGVSLTLVDVENDRFSVALIPHTLSATTLGQRKVGDRVNIETDILAKYVQRAIGGAMPVKD